MKIIAAFLVNAGLNFALGLLVARFLGPDEFGRYAVAMAVAVVINTAFFEWLRLSTTRFYSGEPHAGERAAVVEQGHPDPGGRRGRKERCRHAELDVG